MNNKVLFIVAARSGGHLLPGLQLSKAWLRDNPSGRVFLFTSINKLDARIASDYPFVTVVRSRLGNLPGKKLWRYPLFVYHLFFTLTKSLWYLWRWQPEKVISTGGYLSVPVGIAARCMRVPLELYEVNVEPGRATRFLAPWATSIKVTFEQTRASFGALSPKCQKVLYPLRPLKKEGKESKQSAIKRLNKTYGCGFIADRTTIFVLGGSQGSVFLNQLIQQLIETSPALYAETQFIHQTQVPHIKELKAAYARYDIPAFVFNYEHDIGLLYQAADLVICRAGAGTLFELAFMGKKALVIPLRSRTTQHQMANAIAMQKKHPDLFTVLEQQSLSLDRLSGIILHHSAERKSSRVPSPSVPEAPYTKEL